MKKNGLKGGVIYNDGQLMMPEWLSLVQTAENQGATLKLFWSRRFNKRE